MKLNEPIHFTELTRGQPFCAGVVIMKGERMIVTLNDDLNDEKSRYLRVGGVGGGQEPGETIAECALREAREELDTMNVRLHSSDTTHFHNMDNDEVCTIELTDERKPFLIQRRTNPTPEKPYKPGLPTGPYIYYGIYLAETDETLLRPGDDVSGLLFVPLGKWELLLEEPAISSVLEHGIDLTEAQKIDRTRKLFVPDDESLHMVVKLVRKKAGFAAL